VRIEGFGAQLDAVALQDLRQRLARSRVPPTDTDAWERGVPERWLAQLIADWQAFDTGEFQAYPSPVSAHVDDGDSVDPSRTVDTHLVAGAVAGDCGSQRRIQRDPLTGDVCLSWHNDGVLGVAEIIPHHDSRA
jgi:hypothetical protein